MAEQQKTSPDEQSKAKAFFEKARTVGDTGNYDYAIELYIQGLSHDPEAVDAHQALRDISLKRKASGGKPLGMMERGRLGRPSKDDKQNMLNAEKLLAYDPGNTDAMVSVLQNAHRGGFNDTVLWVGPILERANAEDKRPNYNKFIILKDIYKSLEQWKLATRACQHAAALRPDNMDLQTELKNLGALDTMDKGRYGTAKSFTESVRDAEAQQKLMEQDKGVQDMDMMQRMIVEAEEAWKADPDEPGKIMRLVDALAKTESLESENRAIELLDQQFQKTRQFRFRHRMGQIKLAQLARTERSLRAELEQHPDDEAAKESLRHFMHDRVQEELTEYQLWSDNYPSEGGFRYEVARRQFMLRRYDEAIPILQQVRSDPKYRVEAGVLLGRAFLGAGFVDEAVDTLAEVIKAYQLTGDAKSIEMHYYYGNALEKKGDKEQALKMYSRVAQWNFNYRDVQQRIRSLRQAPQRTERVDLEEA